MKKNQEEKEMFEKKQQEIKNKINRNITIFKNTRAWHVAVGQRYMV
jgi:hypothetical protein